MELECLVMVWTACYPFSMVAVPIRDADVDMAWALGGLDPAATEKLRDCAPRSLVAVVQDLSLARDVPAIMEIVRKAARELTGADGATFVLREGDCCHYVEENAIAPLWKGRQFPMSQCISGWVLLHGEGVAIEDVYADPRIPADVYRPTFVRSLALVPIRTKAPIGAIGNYWAERHCTTPEELSLLQALADSTSVAMENVEVYAELERRVQDRTRALEAANHELLAKQEALAEAQRQREALSALVLHDLKSPASAIMVAAALRLEDDSLSAADRRYWSRALSSADHIHRTALDLLDIASSQQGKLVPRVEAIDLDVLLAEICDVFAPHAERRGQVIEVRSHVPCGALLADAGLVFRVLQNLVDNALRHSPAHSTLRIEARAEGAAAELAVCDEGPGVPPHLRDRVFERYVRVGEDGGYGSANRGLGLTFCRLAVEAHGGTIWIEDNQPRGIRFCFRLPLQPADAPRATGRERAIQGLPIQPPRRRAGRPRGTAR